MLNIKDCLVEMPRVTRLECISGFGRELVERDVTDVQVSFQDDGQTLKIFFKGRDED